MFELDYITMFISMFVATLIMSLLENDKISVFLYKILIGSVFILLIYCIVHMFF